MIIDVLCLRATRKLPRNRDLHGFERCLPHRESCSSVRMFVCLSCRELF